MDYFDYVRCERNDGKGFYGTSGKCNPKVGKPVPPKSSEGKKGEGVEGKEVAGIIDKITRWEKPKQIIEEGVKAGKSRREIELDLYKLNPFRFYNYAP